MNLGGHICSTGVPPMPLALLSWVGALASSGFAGGQRAHFHPPPSLDTVNCCGRGFLPGWTQLPPRGPQLPEAAVRHLPGWAQAAPEVSACSLGGGHSAAPAPLPWAPQLRVGCGGKEEERRPPWHPHVSLPRAPRALPDRAQRPVPVFCAAAGVSQVWFCVPVCLEWLKDNLRKAV